MKIGILLAAASFGLVACGGPQVKTMDPAEAKECKIMYHDVEAGRVGETDYLPRDVALARIKMIKTLPGFPKLTTDQWLSCR